MNLLNLVKDWAMARIKETSTWDGIFLVVAGVSFLIFKPIAVIVAYAAIVYGAWKIYQKETESK